MDLGSYCHYPLKFGSHLVSKFYDLPSKWFKTDTKGSIYKNFLVSNIQDLCFKTLVTQPHELQLFIKQRCSQNAFYHYFISFQKYLSKIYYRFLLVLNVKLLLRHLLQSFLQDQDILVTFQHIVEVHTQFNPIIISLWFQLKSLNLGSPDIKVLDL